MSINKSVVDFQLESVAVADLFGTYNMVSLVKLNDCLGYASVMRL